MAELPQGGRRVDISSVDCCAPERYDKVERHYLVERETEVVEVEIQVDNQAATILFMDRRSPCELIDVSRGGGGVDIELLCKFRSVDVSRAGKQNLLCCLQSFELGFSRNHRPTPPDSAGCLSVYLLSFILLNRARMSKKK